MKKNLLIISADTGYAISALNLYIDALADYYNFFIIEEKRVSLKTILPAIRTMIKKRGIATTVDSILYRLYYAIFVKKIKHSKQYVSHKNVESINSPEAQAWMNGCKADMAIANGCSLISQKTINAVGCPILNIHPGINPRYRGVGNIHAIAENNMSMIGYTIHYVDKGIDTGTIIYINTIKSQNLPSDYFALEDQVIDEARKQLIEFLINGHIYYPDELKGLSSKLYLRPLLSELLRARKNYRRYIKRREQSCK